MSGQKASKNPDGRFKDLRFRVDIKRYPLYDITNSLFEPWRVIEDNEGVECVDQSYRKVPSHIIRGYVSPTLDDTSIKLISYIEDKRTGCAN